MAKYDFLIVGGGLYGCTFAYLAKQSGKKCLIIDKRNNIGGNCRCKDVKGIQVHEFGPHIFHTSNGDVWKFVTDLVPFNNFINEPLANFNGELYHLPFNMNTFYSLWGCKTPDEAKSIIESQKLEIDSPQNLEEQALSMVGYDIYERLIKGYTEKQWGRDCKELPPSIIKRLPLRFSYNNNYFNDRYQGIPEKGYNPLFDKLTEGIDIFLNADYFDDKEYYSSLADKIIYTGPIDRYFNNVFGKLEYRTVEFVDKILSVNSYQGNAVVNYTGADVPYTRIIEHKHFYGGDDLGFTVISKEYSKEWNENSDPYYPINNEANNKIYQKYKDLADKEENVFFGGRLAEYKYYDMDDTIEKAMELWNKIQTI